MKSTMRKISRSKASKSKRRASALLEALCFRRIGHPELMLVRKQNSTSVLTVSEVLALLAILLILAAFLIAFLGCATPKPLHGGQASTTMLRPGRTNLTALSQPENPKQSSRQAVQSQQTVEYVLPAGSCLSLAAPAVPAAQPPPVAPTPVVVLAQPMPVRLAANDRVDTTIGAAQPDTARELAAKAASLQPVMWAGIAMMTLVAGALLYFGWWTKAALSIIVGMAMVVLASALPSHGSLILGGGLAVFALVALLVLYAYYKGQLDQNHNGIPDFLERGGKRPG